MIFATLLIALILRLININQSLWLDEGIQWWASTSFPIKHLVTEYITGDFNPPLFHTVLHYWLKIFPQTEFFLRLPSVIFGVLTVLFVYKISKHLKTLPNLTALLVATSPLLIYYSQEARMYSLATLTITATIFYLLKSEKQKKYLIHYSLFLILSLYSHYLTWLLLPLLFFLSPIPTLISTLTFSPFVTVFLKQLTVGTQTANVNPIWSSLSSFSLKSVALVPVKFLIGRLPVNFTPVYLLLLVIPLSLAAYLFIKSKNLKLHLIFFSPLAFGALISLKIPIFTYFRFLYLLPVFYIILTLGASKTKFKKIFILFFLVLNLISSGTYLFNPFHHREDWKSAVKTINRPVVINSAVTPPLAFYNQGRVLVITEKNLEKTQRYSEIYYISYAQPIFDPANNIYSTLENFGFIETEKTHFRGVTVIKMQNKEYKHFTLLR